MSWVKITLTSQQEAAGLHARLQDNFEAVFIGLRAPKDMAMFADNSLARESFDTNNLFLA